MKRIAFLFTIAFFALKTINGMAQNNSITVIPNPATEKIEIMADPDSEIIKSDEIYYAITDPAEFPGGKNLLIEWLNKHVRYPSEAWQNHIEGSAKVKFVVERDGSITNGQVINEVHPLLEKEVLRVISKMPKWIPGRNNGEIVRSYFFMPITFKIPSENTIEE